MSAFYMKKETYIYWIHTFRAVLLPWVLAPLLLPSASGQANNPITPDRCLNWNRSFIGVPGGIPYRTNIFCNVISNIPGTNIVAIADGLSATPTDNTAAFNAAFALCPSNQVVYIPTGDYVCSNQINVLNNGVTIRGDGTNTVLHGRMRSSGWSFINVGGYIGALGYAPVTSGATRGSSNIVVASLPASVTQNNAMIKLSQTIDYPYVHALIYTSNQVPNPGGTNLMSIAAWVTATTPTSITFWPPLPFDLTNSPVFYTGFTGRGAMFTGLENLRITNDTPSSFCVYFERCYGCWVSNIESAYTSQAHVYARHSICCEFRDSYVHDFYGAGGGNCGEGIELYSDCSGCLIENNIVYHCFPGINTSGNSSGNVIDYNYGYDAQSGSILIGNDDDANHGAHNVMNLWEGNVGVMFQSDGYYGSASHITVFRGYYSGTHPTLTYHRICVDLTHWSDYFNIVGNVLGTSNWPGSYIITSNNYPYPWPTIYRFGYPSMGNNGYSNWNTNPPSANLNDYDCMVSNTVSLVDNFDYCCKGVVNPVDNLPPSLFYTSTPGWWPTNVSWPPIGPDLTPMVQQIPAQVRFAQLGITVVVPTNQLQSQGPIASVQIGSPPCLQITGGNSTPKYCPGTDPTVVEWLRADGGLNLMGTNVTIWVADVGQNAIRTNYFSAPTLVKNAQNGLPAISFDGVCNAMQTTPFPTVLQQPFTIFIVYSWTASPAAPSFVYDGIDSVNRAALLNNNGSTPSNQMAVYYGAGGGYSTGVSTNSAWTIAEFQVNGASSTCLFNGGADAPIPGVQSSAALAGLTLGSRYNETEFANVSIGELIIVNGLPTSNESAIIAYLRGRWATF
jgi:hypothetical protein